MFSKIGIIGTGNMGSALAAAIEKGDFDGDLLLANRSTEKAQALCKTLGRGIVAANEQIAQSADLILLCVKPQIMPQVLAPLTDIFKKRNSGFVLCTVAAGLTCENICQLAGGEYPVSRIMPNTPVSLGCGMIQLCSKNTEKQAVDEFIRLLSPAGQIDVIEERLIDAACAVSGCGPAFAYLFAEALADGGVACGLSRKSANLYAAKMLEGAAKMLQNSGKTPGQLKDAVCSPAGATIEGVLALEQAGFRGAVMDAVLAAYEKSVKLGEKK